MPGPLCWDRCAGTAVTGPGSRRASSAIEEHPGAGRLPRNLPDRGAVRHLRRVTPALSADTGHDYRHPGTLISPPRSRSQPTLRKLGANPQVSAVNSAETPIAGSELSPGGRPPKVKGKQRKHLAGGMPLQTSMRNRDSFRGEISIVYDYARLSDSRRWNPAQLEEGELHDPTSTKRSPYPRGSGSYGTSDRHMP